MNRPIDRVLGKASLQRPLRPIVVSATIGMRVTGSVAEVAITAVATCWGLPSLAPGGEREPGRHKAMRSADRRQYVSP